MSVITYLGSKVAYVKTYSLTNKINKQEAKEITHSDATLMSKYEIALPTTLKTVITKDEDAKNTIYSTQRGTIRDILKNFAEK